MQKNLLIIQAYYFVNINFFNCQNFIIFVVCLIAICFFFLLFFWWTKIMRIQILNPNIYSGKLHFKWTSNQSIIVFKKFNTPSPFLQWFGPRYRLSWVFELGCFPCTWKFLHIFYIKERAEKNSICQQSGLIFVKYRKTAWSNLLF